MSPGVARRGGASGSAQRAVVVVLALTLAGAASIVLALTSGELPIPVAAVFRALTGAIDGIEANVVMQLRLPRAVAVFVCGGLLAMAGALMQVLLRNPLADPYVLGISGGAAVGALSAMLFGLTPWLVDVSAFAGAMTAMLLVFGLAHGDGSWTQTRLLLTGVIVAAGCGAVITLLLSLTADNRVMSMLFWLMGDASGARNPWPAALVMLVGLALVMPFARDLNVLARGETIALALGVRVQRLRYLLYVVASLLTAVAVTLIGSVGFVGLVVPHLVRFVIGNDQRLLLPAAMLAGGTLLTLADTAARTVIAPLQLPVGVLTALIGVPVFLFLLSRTRRAT
ncbi:FecCD family ABC transporter permease [Rhodocyclaceae bacterium SMB388]